MNEENKELFKQALVEGLNRHFDKTIEEAKKIEQIEEMAECCPYFWNGACTVDAANPTDCDLMCEMFGFMTSLANAGYRKQKQEEKRYD